MMAKMAVALAAAAGVLAGCAADETYVVGHPEAQRAGLYGRKTFPPALVWDVVFTGRPDRAALRGAYPARAQALGLNGAAAAECQVGAQGQLSRCAVIDEKPAGFGFGPAAVALADDIRVSTRTLSGRNLAGKRVRYRISFETGPRFSQVGFCERVKLELEGWTGDRATLDSAGARLHRLTPLFLPTAAAAAQRIESLGPTAQVVVREQPDSARRIAEECELRRDRDMDFGRAAPEAFSVWIDERGEAHLVERPNFAVQPLAADIRRVYPPAARVRGIKGRAAVQCRVSAAGALHGCIVIAETPPGLGFGAAATRLVQTSARMTPEKVDGSPSDHGFVNVPVEFMVD